MRLVLDREASALNDLLDRLDFAAGRSQVAVPDGDGGGEVAEGDGVARRGG